MIVWYGGGYKTGEYNDLQLARLEFVHQLGDGEKAIGDKGYKDSRYFLYPKWDLSDMRKRVIKKIMARHEDVNGRIKDYNCMMHHFRHGWEKHNCSFESIIRLVQIKIENGQPLASISLT